MFSVELPIVPVWLCSTCTLYICVVVAKCFVSPKTLVSHCIVQLISCHLLVFSAFHLDLVVARDEKYGGPISFKTYTELEAAYVRQDIYPLDLKNAVTLELNKVSQNGAAKANSDIHICRSLHMHLVVNMCDMCTPTASGSNTQEV